MTKLSLLSAVMLFVFIAPSTLTRADDSLVVLQYHHVSNQKPAITSVTPERFEQHLELIDQLGIEVVALDWALERIRNQQPIPQPAIAITFDDGYRSVLTQAHPRLRARNWPYTLFTTPPKTDNGTEQFLGWNELRHLRREGVLIANHSLNHQHLIRLRPQESVTQWRHRTRQQLQSAQQQLEQQLGPIPPWLAYPYGEFNMELLELLNSLDWLGFGQHSGPISQHSDLQALPRFPASGRYSELSTLKDKLLSMAMPVDNVRTEPVTEGWGRWRVRLKAKPFEQQTLSCFVPEGIQQQPQWIDELNFRIEARVPPGRSRFNCTAPVPGQQRFYWLSQPWITPNSDGSWVHD